MSDTFYRLLKGQVDEAMKACLVREALYTRVTAAPQPSAPVVACKAYCGLSAESDEYAETDDSILSGTAFEVLGWEKSGGDDRRFCSPACRAARLPPLAAQPAEANSTCKGGCGRRLGGTPRDYCVTCKPFQSAEQPKPAAKAHDFSDPYCVVRRGILACVACGVARQFDCVALSACVPRPGWRERVEFAIADNTTGILRDPAIPERIVKPPMAHSSQWADEAEDA
jgi:hypothetical protein